jgi:signal peptidase I
VSNGPEKPAPPVPPAPARVIGGTTRPRRPRRTDRQRRKGEREGWRETVRFWFWAILIMVVVRAFLIEPYRIPSPSMEETLLVGDFLFVSKLHYGARTPNTIGVPFTGVYLRGVELPQTRLPGFSRVKRGDVAVFNYPPDPGPVERRTPYIKRLVGLPGDRVVLVDKVLYVNDERHPLTARQMQHWRVVPAEGQTISLTALRATGIELVGQVQRPEPAYVVNATAREVETLRTVSGVGGVTPFSIPEGALTGEAFPLGSGFNRDNYGPLAVPRAGQTVTLTAENWPAYRDVIVRYEGQSAEALPDGSFRIAGASATEYTFGQDYYFAMGDNRDNSQDSRFWGFVPDDHLVGKAVLVFFSLDFERPLLGFLPRLRLRGFHPIR